MLLLKCKGVRWAVWAVLSGLSNRTARIGLEKTQTVRFEKKYQTKPNQTNQMAVLAVRFGRFDL